MAKQTTDSYLIAASYLELGDTFLNIKNYKNICEYLSKIKYSKHL